MLRLRLISPPPAVRPAQSGVRGGANIAGSGVTSGAKIAGSDVTNGAHIAGSDTRSGASIAGTDVKSRAQAPRRKSNFAAPPHKARL